MRSKDPGQAGLLEPAGGSIAEAGSLGCLLVGGTLTQTCTLWLASMTQNTLGGVCRMSTASGSPAVQLSSTFKVTVRGL